MLIDNWWEAVDLNWDKLMMLVERFHPASIGPKTKYPITANKAEGFGRIIRADIKERFGDRMPCLIAKDAKEKKDYVLMYDILNQTWFGMPESENVRREPGFFLLCELCEGVDSDD